MDPALAKLLEKGAKEAVKKAIRYIRDDQEKSYALDETVSFFVEYQGIGRHPAFRTEDGSLEYEPLDFAHCRVTCYPFPASSRLWNGPDVIGDETVGRMASSLVHDLWWGHRKEIAAAWGMDVPFVLTYGNQLLDCIWKMFEPKSWVRRAAFGVCEWAKPWYHAAKRMLGLGCLALAFAGCGLLNAPEDWRVVCPTDTNAVARAMERAMKSPSQAAAGAVPDGGSGLVSPVETAAGEDSAKEVEEVETGRNPTSSTSSTSSISSTADAVDFSALRWEYGGFGGKGAVAVNGCTISGLKVSSSGMSYKWEGGGCEQLGASSRTAADCIAALFVRGSDGQWRGGKFDWISTSRTTRDFKNISEGYHGWPTDAIGSAKGYAFVVVSSDGKRRSNVTACGR